MAGAGVALLSESIAVGQLSGVVLRTTVPEIRRELGLVYRAEQLSPAAEAFLAVAEQDSSAT
jgi:DNA-binding transcriptional LysR family regulator